MKLDTLSSVVIQSARLTGQSVKRECLDDIKNALGRARATASSASLVQLAWKAARLDGRPSVLKAPRPHECPLIGWHADQGWFVVTSHNADGSWLAQDAKGATLRLRNLAGVECVSLPAKSDRGASVPKASRLIWKAIWQRKTIFFEALLATVLVTMLALVASVFSMQCMTGSFRITAFTPFGCFRSAWWPRSCWNSC